MRLKNEPVRRGELFYAPKPSGAAAPKFLTTPDIDNCGWAYNISSFCISHKLMCNIGANELPFQVIRG